MKRTSVKLRITLWLTALMALLAATLLLFLLLISSRVLTMTARQQLSHAVKANLDCVSMEESGLKLSADFSFYSGGVTTLVYSRNESLLAGQIPVSFKSSPDFENGLIRSVEQPEGSYLLLDVWLPEGWDNGLWLRGLIELPDSGQATGTMLTVALAVLPVFLLLSALGAYLILRRSFMPLQRISDTAEAINDGGDLSRRIGIKEGRDEFTRLAAVFDRLLGRLERAFEAEKQFTADASHELRTPVSVIKGACEFSRKYGETEQEMKESMEMIERQADRMSGLINRLLSMTRLEQGTEQLKAERLELCALTEEFLTEQGDMAERALLERRERVFVKADALLLKRLMQNLFDNAMRYGGGRLRLSVYRENGSACLSFSDEGPGIAPEEQEKIWQRFYRGDPSHSENARAGLGLSLVRQIAQSHGGMVELESSPGRGSCFTLKIPEIL